jgi:molybdopterin-guanine dinucleotide biosynthesis protein A
MGRRVIAGIFVGGAGARMGGAAKGLLEAPEGGTLLARWKARLAEAGIEAILVGRHPAYVGAAAAGLPAIEDDPPGIGPLGGLVALLRRAGSGPALAFACDMPFVSAALIERLAAAREAPIVAPRRAGRWEPLCARYDASVVLPSATRRVACGAYALQGLLDEAGAVALRLSPDEERELRDWDTPAAIERDVPDRTR